MYSVREAEHLIVGLMRERGLPHGDFDAMFQAMLQYRTLFEALLERPKREDGVEGSAPPAAGWVSSGSGVPGATR